MKKKLSIDGLRLPDTEVGSHTIAKMLVLLMKLKVIRPDVRQNHMMMNLKDFERRNI